jgi:predicted DNA-binding ribbon-helix-helix protein
VTPRPKKGKSLLTRKSIYIRRIKSTSMWNRHFGTLSGKLQMQRVLRLKELIARIDRSRNTPNLSSAIRLFVLDHYVRLAEAKTKQ